MEKRKVPFRNKEAKTLFLKEQNVALKGIVEYKTYKRYMNVLLVR